MSFKISINQWISFKRAQQNYKTSNKIILLEIRVSESYSLNALISN